MKDVIKRFTETFGPSGYEEKIREVIINEIKDYADYSVDKLGNLIVRKEGKGKKIMFAAHMDEIGLMVTHIDDKGFLRFTNIGGLFPTNLVNQRVIFSNGLVGVIGEEPRKDFREVSPIDKLFIDIGMPNKKEAEKKIRIGEVGVFYRGFDDLGNRFISKALDDRIGCVVLAEVIKKIKNPLNDLYFVFTVQEELGLRGARTSAFGIDPDYAIAIDVTGTGDIPESPKIPMELGKGTCIKVKDYGMISSRYVREKLIEIAERKKIPYQLEILLMGTTDAAVIQLNKEGVPSGVLSVPTRYVHSPSELADYSDVQATIDLLLAFAQEKLD
uniref:M42 family peptidase n=1 Tax=candidate division WOR-3 bacterium TaxID=2052148 RepID=A0A7C4Y659_UNCW3